MTYLVDPVSGTFLLKGLSHVSASMSDKNIETANRSVEQLFFLRC